MNTTYLTLERKRIPLAGLNATEKRFLGRLSRHFKENAGYLDFENAYTDPESPVYRHAKRLGRFIKDTPLYQVCDDLSKRLGIRQGYLVREEVVALYAKHVSIKELTSGEVAKLAGCTDEAVRKAIRTQRLRARRVGRYSLIAEEDALAFAAARKSKKGRSP